MKLPEKLDIPKGYSGYSELRNSQSDIVTFQQKVHANEINGPGPAAYNLP